MLAKMRLKIDTNAITMSNVKVSNVKVGPNFAFNLVSREGTWLMSVCAVNKVAVCRALGAGAEPASAIHSRSPS